MVNNETQKLEYTSLPPIPLKTAVHAHHEPTIHNEKVKLIHSKLREEMDLLSSDEFGLTTEELDEICSFDNRNSESLVENLNTKFGGPLGVAIKLRTDPSIGLKTYDVPHNVKQKKGKVSPEQETPTVKKVVQDAELRQKMFGSNIIPPPPSQSIFSMIIGQIKEDPILKILIVGAIIVISLGSAICPSSGWVDGFTILIAVILVLGVTSGNDWSKEKKFKKLLLLQSDKKVKVLRNGVKDQISSWDLVIGDLVEVSPGDEIPVDGLFFSGTRLMIDESPLTGETLPVKKNEKNPFVFSGCQVNEGNALILTTAVGAHSSGGKIQLLLNEAQSQETVLQVKLGVVAVQIGKIGVAAGILTFFGLAIRWAIDWAHDVPLPPSHCSGSSSANDTLSRLQELATHFVVGVTIVVVAVPEGLPLAVTISLAFSMFKMMKDKCFVRQLDASETMGQATCICTDKTGTLTENRMTAVKIFAGEKEYFGAGSGHENAAAFTPTTLPESIKVLLTECACLNSSCFVKYKEDSPLPIFVGSATEGALLVLSEKLGVNYNQVRETHTTSENGIWDFNSERKRMSTLIEKSETTFRLYTKGASEIVFSLCESKINEDGQPTILTADEKTKVQNKIKDWASEGLRTFVLAYKDTTERYTVDSKEVETSLTFVSLVGIKDPLRKEVPGAVLQCQKAGLKIKMVTGDNILTASKIARECGILTNGIAMEGPDFRALSESEKRKVALKLQVLARSSPSDKFILVSLLKSMGEVVAVTGDGTNDAPALKEADVGFSMGICGTQIAMNASDIVLMDDNFVSLVQSIRWGRNVLNSVRKFLQFQLGVNLIAIILTFIGAITSGVSPLNTVQLLWVNLIMDTLGALALASDEPEDDILETPPHPRDAPLISQKMKEYMLIQIIYQVTVLLVILLQLDNFMVPTPEHILESGHSYVTKRTSTVVFCVFIFCQCSNLVMSRKLNGELNFLGGFTRNKLFLFILSVIITVQLLTVVLAQDFMSTTSLNWEEWLLVALLAVGNFVFTFFVKVFAKNWNYERKRNLNGALSKSNLSLYQQNSNEMKKVKSFNSGKKSSEDIATSKSSMLQSSALDQYE
ncbi:Calcium-transporting ATPase 10, plasma membrane-type [Lobulomyces angularis]|nr:Calcium-transporting ATPase 10, plasma membrane-type [Lobulomyces angularis]